MYCMIRTGRKKRGIAKPCVLFLRSFALMVPAFLCYVLEKVGLNSYPKRAVCKYSLGMRQRMAIAQANMEEPDILILDEPMNGLDKKGVREMRELFLQMKVERKTILLVSHNREDIDVLYDKVCEMEDDVLKVLLKHKITVTFRKK